MALGKGEMGVERSESGQIVRVKSDRHVLDPRSPEAVQVPEQEAPSDHLADAYADADEDLTAVLDQNVKLGDRTEELLDEASRTHQTAPLVARSASDAGAAVDATDGQHTESATSIVAEETAKREQERREQAEESEQPQVEHEPEQPQAEQPSA